MLAILILACSAAAFPLLKDINGKPSTLDQELDHMYELLSRLSLLPNATIRDTICIVPIIQEPVCGSDQQTYASRYLLDCTVVARGGTGKPGGDLTVAHEGKC